MRIRIKFEKKQPVQYLGHLDILRFFQRCLNRADVRMEYSDGFHPHQKMSFAQPLGVGILSRGEYLDAEVQDGQDLEEIRRKLNRVCGDGFSVSDVKAVREGAKKAMAALAFASYEVDLSALRSVGAPLQEAFDASMEKAVQALLAAVHLPVMKTTKSGTREVDIRPQICSLRYEEGMLHLFVTAGSDNNLKPDVLLSELFAKTNLAYQRESVTIIRTDLYAEKDVPLSRFQTRIL